MKYSNGYVYMTPKWAILIGFVALNTTLLVSLRGCSIYSSHSTEYIASTVVVCTELTKLVISIGCSFVFDANGSCEKFLDVIMRTFLDDGLDILKLCLPALLYAIQNNLQYIIETAPLFLVLYQSKIVTTAIFFTNMLSRRLSIKKWCTIIFLALGVGMVESSQQDILPHHASDLGGLLSVCTACVTSGFAGVYFEKVLKSSRSSIWMINLELSMMSSSFSTILAMVQDPQEIIDYGIFKGFNVFVVLIILLQAINGLGVALVVKYSDNIHKGFVASVAICLAAIVDALVFGDVALNYKFVTGASFVLLSSLAFFLLSWHYLSPGPALPPPVILSQSLHQPPHPVPPPVVVVSLPVFLLCRPWVACLSWALHQPPVSSSSSPPVSKQLSSFSHLLSLLSPVLPVGEGGGRQEDQDGFSSPSKDRDRSPVGLETPSFSQTLKKLWIERWIYRPPPPFSIPPPVTVFLSSSDRRSPVHYSPLILTSPIPLDLSLHASPVAALPPPLPPVLLAASSLLPPVHVPSFPAMSMGEEERMDRRSRMAMK